MFKFYNKFYDLLNLFSTRFLSIVFILTFLVCKFVVSFLAIIVVIRLHNSRTGVVVTLPSILVRESNDFNRFAREIFLHNVIQ